MKIVCLDPSLSNTGFVVLQGTKGDWSLSNLGLLTTESSNAAALTKGRKDGIPKSKIATLKKNIDDLGRAKLLIEGLDKIVVDADYVCVELPQIGGADMQARSMWSSGIVLGIIANLKGPLVCVTPKDVKMVTGCATSSKEDMVSWATHLYPNAPWLKRKLKGEMVLLKTNHHIADALAAGVAGLTSINLW